MVRVPVGQEDVVYVTDIDAASFEFLVELTFYIWCRDACIDKSHLTVTFEKVERVAPLKLVVF
jgi:hypothetical protein